ncbi:MAG: hypothetical protein QNJ72_13500 [Pleurocapsa sp. MO_226.B13]|nr:hypothetical protein [Pleurocapsa sp. MO_226.B13]
MSQKKAIANWKRTEYLLIKNRKKRNQNQSERELLFLRFSQRTRIFLDQNC